MQYHLEYLMSIKKNNISHFDIINIKDKYQLAINNNKKIILNFNEKVYNMMTLSSLINYLPNIEKMIIIYSNNTENTKLIHTFIIEIYDKEDIKKNLLDRNINIQIDNKIFDTIKNNWHTINDDVKNTVFNYIYDLILLCEHYLLNYDIIKQTRNIVNILK